jgi:hypothetical protein
MIGTDLGTAAKCLQIGISILKIVIDNGFFVSIMLCKQFKHVGKCSVSRTSGQNAKLIMRRPPPFNPLSIFRSLLNFFAFSIFSSLIAIWGNYILHHRTRLQPISYSFREIPSIPAAIA